MEKELICGSGNVRLASSWGGRSIIAKVRHASFAGSLQPQLAIWGHTSHVPKVHWLV